MSGLSRPDPVVCAVLLPSDADPRLPAGVLELDSAASSPELLPGARPWIRPGLRLALFSATGVAPPLIGRLPPLGRLSTDDRERALEAMASSRVGILRQLVVLLKLTAAMAYGADTTVRERLGYAGERTT